MILVLLGTQTHSFTRLLEYVEALNTQEEVIIQKGHTPYEGKYKNFDFSNDLESYLEKADILITHGGVGSILLGLEHNCRVIAVPRLLKHQEHVDDHQIEICENLVKKNNILMANKFEELDEQIETIKKHKFSPYKSNNKEFNQQLDLIVNDLLKG